MLSAILICLALNVYHEARGESLAGQYAVAHVTMNRVADSRWPSGVCAVVKQGGEWPLHKCQFSWWCDGRSDKARDSERWYMAVNVSRRVLSGAPDITQGATHYLNPDKVRRTPPWTRHLVSTGRIGNHVFYR